MNQHLDEATFRATHEPHGELRVTDIPVKLPGAVAFVEITCSRCGKSITKAKESVMPKKKVEATQPPLVPLTEQEKAQLPGNLAAAVQELEEMERQHKKVASDNAKDRKQVKAKISSYASQIAGQGR